MSDRFLKGSLEMMMRQVAIIPAAAILPATSLPLLACCCCCDIIVGLLTIGSHKRELSTPTFTTMETSFVKVSIQNFSFPFWQKIRVILTTPFPSFLSSSSNCLDLHVELTIGRYWWLCQLSQCVVCLENNNKQFLSYTYSRMSANMPKYLVN